LAVTDGTDFGASPSPASTTSGTRALGTDDADHIQDGDTLVLNFSSMAAVGITVLSRDPLQNGDLLLTAGGETAALDASAVEQTLADGSQVWFLGVTAAGATISAATVGYVADGGTEFLWNADDVILAVPEPDTAVALTVGVALLAFLTHHRARKEANE
jgi:hypothetical protein